MTLNQSLTLQGKKNQQLKLKKELITEIYISSFTGAERVTTTNSDEASVIDQPERDAYFCQQIKENRNKLKF